jgi:hypothetical protein
MQRHGGQARPAAPAKSAFAPDKSAFAPDKPAVAPDEAARDRADEDRGEAAATNATAQTKE